MRHSAQGFVVSHASKLWLEDQVGVHYFELVVTWESNLSKFDICAGYASLAPSSMVNVPKGTLLREVIFQLYLSKRGYLRMEWF